MLSLLKSVKPHEYLVVNFDNLNSSDLYKFECKKVLDFINKKEGKNFEYNSLENLIISNFKLKESSQNYQKNKYLMKHNKKYYLLWNILLSKYG